jgi:FlaA1/EpsC-like NDP-sugar epimerase
VDHLIDGGADVVRVFGRDETKQFYQRHRVPSRNVRFLIGDVRDRDRMLRACEGIDTVFHCAALKHVESGEYNPFEATQTNVLGTQNVIDACLATGVGTMILTSSDKAHPTTFASVRFGNVLGSRGSALELFAQQVAAGGPVTVTDPEMTRFVMSTDRAVDLAIEAAHAARGGEVFVFKMPAVRLDDLITAAIEVVAPMHGLEPAAIGRRAIEPRAGEKAYEELMTEDESTRAHDIGEMYAVLPSIELDPRVRAAYADRPAAPVGAYRSDAVAPLDYEAVRRLIAETLEADRQAIAP